MLSSFLLSLHPKCGWCGPMMHCKPPRCHTTAQRKLPRCVQIVSSEESASENIHHIFRFSLLHQSDYADERAQTLVRPSCWVFCFFLGLSPGSSTSSASSVGTKNIRKHCQRTFSPFFLLIFLNFNSCGWPTCWPNLQHFVPGAAAELWEGNTSDQICLSAFKFFCHPCFIFTFEPVGSVATVSTLPVCPRQQCLAFTLFLSEFHSHSSTVWSREAVSSREVKPSKTKISSGELSTFQSEWLCLFVTAYLF